MDWWEALILGLLQGLTEFLPVSSSGHLELGKVVLGIEAERSLIFTVTVHGATVLSTIVVFRKDLWSIMRSSLMLRWNDETRYLTLLLFSMIPVLVVGLTLSGTVESMFSGNLLLVGPMLLITAALLAGTHLVRPRERGIGYLDALIIGIAQAIAVIPGISRSGATISTGLLLGNRRDEIARFSFLMVLLPIIGANILDMFKEERGSSQGVGMTPLIIGFLGAFISGLVACRWMIGIVKRGKLYHFAIYCALIGLIALAFGLFS
ncbi:MAG: undecaprenyl-diphosphate phosphatase [Bacteroidales bacterium]|nr:undecaprenyl-diphosphate phosphatase [Bacteroidales bacterium]